MNHEKILEEIKKCRENPYYFATTYLTVQNHIGETVKFTTPMTEEEFNRMAFSLTR